MADELDLKDRHTVVETCLSMTRYIDERRWDDLEQVFADDIEIDYTSIFGGRVATTTRAEYGRTARALLGNLDATQHLVAGHIVTGSGDDARCVSQVQAVHIKANRTGDAHFTVGAQYDMRLVRIAGEWRIKAVTATFRWASGNREVMRLGKLPRSDA